MQVHGANFCFIMRRLRHDGEDSVQVRCGKRREVLGEDEDFFGHAVLLERVRPKAINLFCAIEGQRNAVLANHVGGLRALAFFLTFLFLHSRMLCSEIRELRQERSARQRVW